MTATTGADGKGRLDVPPGTYSVKASAEKFSPVTIQKLTVTVGKAVGSTAKLRAKEEATSQSKQTVEVTGVVKEASEATQLQQRKEATTVGDSVGHEAIAKTTDSRAAEVVRRVPAVTIQDNKYIVVRGLDRALQRRPAQRQPPAQHRSQPARRPARHLPGRLHRGAQHHQDLHPRPAGRLRRRPARHQAREAVEVHVPLSTRSASTPRPPSRTSTPITAAPATLTSASAPTAEHLRHFGDPLRRAAHPTTPQMRADRQPCRQLDHRLRPHRPISTSMDRRQHVGTLRHRPGRHLQAEYKVRRNPVNSVSRVRASRVRRGRDFHVHQSDFETQLGALLARNRRSIRTTVLRQRPGQPPRIDDVLNGHGTDTSLSATRPVPYQPAVHGGPARLRLRSRTSTTSRWSTSTGAAAWSPSSNRISRTASPATTTGRRDPPGSRARGQSVRAAPSASGQT